MQRKIQVDAAWIRLAVAFLLSLLLGFAVINGMPIYSSVSAKLAEHNFYGINPSVLAVLVVVLFPLGIGIAAALTGSRKHVVLSALGTGLTAWTGVGCYPLYAAVNADAAEAAHCATNYCHVGPLETALTTLYLIAGTVLVILGSVITALIMKHSLRRMEKPVEEGRAERKVTGYAIAIRLVLALILGLLISFILASAPVLSLYYYETTDFYYLFPLCIGIVAALTVSRRNRHNILSGLVTGLSVWAGISCLSLYSAFIQDATRKAYCAANTCDRVPGIESNLVATSIEVLNGAVLVIVGAVIIGFLMKYSLRIGKKQQAGVGAVSYAPQEVDKVKTRKL